MRVTTLAQNSLLKANVNTIQTRLVTLYDQVSSEKRSTQFSGLREDSRVTIDLRTRVSSLEHYRTNIAQGRVRLQTQEQVLSEVVDIASTVRNDLLGLRNGGAVDTTLVRQVAVGEIERVISLFNTQLQGRFLFSGVQSGTQTMLGSAGPTAAVAAEVTGYTDANAAARLANIQGFFAAPGNYYQGDTTAGQYPQLRVDEGLDVTLSARGDDQAIQELFSGLYIAATLEYDAANDAGFFTLLEGALDQLQSASDGLNRLLAQVGTDQAMMEDIETRFVSMETVFAREIDEIENVDMAATVSDLNATEAQLQATYQVISTTRGLSLANVL